jgi:amino acid adenylation domain-containing protein
MSHRRSPAGYLLTHSVDNSADRAPNAPAFALGGEGQALTYAELARRTNTLANALRAHGVKRHDRVGILMNKSLELPVALYGTLKAGAAYVPLDPQAPPARLRAMVTDCGIRHIVTQPSKRQAIEHLIATDVTLDCLYGIPVDTVRDVASLDWKDIDTGFPARSPDIPALEDDLAYIIYTSGSTGTPKGIMHAHRSGLAYARLTSDLYDLRPEDRVSDHPPLHSDMSTLEYLGAPLAGACTVIIPEEYTKLPASLTKLVQDEAITVWYSVVSALIQMSTRGVMDQRDLSALRWVHFCGEPMPAKSLRTLMAMLPNAQFSNVYGPAEVNQCTYYNVPAPPASDAEPVPIGKVWSNTEALVLDEHDQEVSNGDNGELVVRSATMMRGYWNRPDLNARVFYTREVLPGYTEAFYRTGDLVKQNASGDYLFLGRLDRQIKTRGHRVELDEVEAAMNARVEIEESAAFPVPDEEIGNRIEAAIVLSPAHHIAESELMLHLKRTLPRYAVPTSINVLEAFPRTPTGKIDRPALRQRALDKD